MKDWKFHSAVLGVREDASAKEVRRAYRRLALERHPDKHNNSTRAKEDFQQLNESYRFLMSGLIEGRRPEPAPPPQQKTAGKQASPFSAPVAQRQPSPPAPSRQTSNPAKVWLHSAAICMVLLVVSIAAEFSGNREPASGRDKRDLFPRAWCLITPSGAGTKTSEFWSQRVCEERCNSAAKQSEVSCSWSGSEFRTLASAANPAPEPKPEEKPPGDCQISLDRGGGQVSRTPARNWSEAACRAMCNEKANAFSRAGIHCEWNGVAFMDRARYVPPPEEQGSDPIADAVMGAQAYTPPTKGEGFRSVCFMSVVMPGNARAESFPNETEDSCANRCISIVMQHPLDREVRCAFGSKELVRHFPDATASFLARKATDQPGQILRQGNAVMGNCEVYGVAGGKRVSASAGLSNESDCSERCRFETIRASEGTSVTCTFGGSPIAPAKSQR